MTTTFSALDPRSSDPAVTRVPLAEPRALAAGDRVVVVRSMPPGSGVGAAADAIAAGLSRVVDGLTAQTYLRQVVLADSTIDHDAAAELGDRVVYVAGPAATMVGLGAVFCSAMEARGVPTVLVAFEPVAATLPAALSAVGAPIRAVVAPAVGRTADDDAKLAAGIAKAFAATVTDDDRRDDVREPHAHPDVLATGTIAEIDDAFREARVSDGLPIVPPTADAVARLLDATGAAPDAVVCEAMMPRRRRVTVRDVAVNAAMTGLPPALFPALLAASTVLGDQNFESMTRSVNSFSFPIEVGGTDTAALGIESGAGALSPDATGNIRLARALRLVIRNGGGAVPGITGSPTQGSNVVMAFAEHPDSPWGPASPEPSDDAASFVDAAEPWVSVYTGGMSHAGNLYYADLDEIGRHLAAGEMPGQGAVVFLSLKRARHYADEGMSREQVEDALHERALMRVGDWRANGFFPAMKSMMTSDGPMRDRLWPQWYLEADDDEMVPAIPRRNLLVRVVGDDAASVAQAWWIRRHRSAPISPWLRSPTA